MHDNHNQPATHPAARGSRNGSSGRPELVTGSIPVSRTDGPLTSEAIFGAALRLACALRVLPESAGLDVCSPNHRCHVAPTRYRAGRAWYRKCEGHFTYHLCSGRRWAARQRVQLASRAKNACGRNGYEGSPGVVARRNSDPPAGWSKTLRRNVCDCDLDFLRDSNYPRGVCIDIPTGWVGSTTAVTPNADELKL
jgi:hypothetical protein